MRSRSLIVLLAIVGVVYFLYVDRGDEKVPVGELAPLFRLPHGEGSEVALEELRGRAVLLNFWATWCPPCVLEMPSLSRLQDLLKDKGLEVVTVSLDDNWQTVKAFAETHHLTMTILWDREGETAGRYGTFRLPESFLIDRQGTIVKRYLGPRVWTEPKLVAEILQHVDVP